MSTAAPAPAASIPEDEPRDHPVAFLVTGLASAATAAIVLTAGGAWASVSARPASFGLFVGLTFVLQLVSVEIYGRGSISFAGTGMLALGFTFGPGAAMAAAVAMGIVNGLKPGARIQRTVFDMAQWALAAGVGGTIYAAFARVGDHPLAQLGPAFVAGAAFLAVNIGLLSTVMGLTEGVSPLEVWRERFRWVTPYYLASGPLALALTIAYERLGVTGLAAFAIPPAFMMLSVRQYLSRTRASVQDARIANEELRRANAELAARNDDLHELFQFAGGLAARAHDREELAVYAESALRRLTGGDARLSFDEDADGVGLFSGGIRVGSVDLARPDGERWARLAETILPQLATAVESGTLVEQVRKTHLATIAALSRSMEAKDYYTGGHTERVSDFAVALARRLGYSGRDLDAIEIGALLHDIGKIGIPERILHKPAALDEDEWKVMREHPVISEYILAEADLPPIVLQIARSSHERIDGTGYPDALAGDEIPLPARIVLVADAFDALTSDRPYRQGRHVAAALDELRAGAGKQFCPIVVAELEALYREEPHILGAARLRAVDVA